MNDPDSIFLMRETLKKLGRLPADATDDQVVQTHAELIAAQQRHTPAPARPVMQAFDSDQAREARSLSAWLVRNGVDAFGLDLPALRAEASGVKRQIEKRRRLDAERKRRQRAEELFAAAECPQRHTLNLDAIKGAGAEKWIEKRDLMLEQARYASGCMCALLGRRGVGKTQLCVSIIHRLCGEGFSCRYAKGLDFFRELRASFGSKHGQSEAAIIDRFSSYDMLVIDEVHQRGETVFEQNCLANLADRRYDAQLVTVFCGNQTPAEFSEAIGPSIASRIVETGAIIECDWPSFRKPGRWRQSEGAPRRVARLPEADE